MWLTDSTDRRFIHRHTYRMSKKKGMCVCKRWREGMKGDLQGANETTKGRISYLVSEGLSGSFRRRTDQLAARTRCRLLSLCSNIKTLSEKTLKCKIHAHTTHTERERGGLRMRSLDHARYVSQTPRIHQQSLFFNFLAFQAAT